MNEPTCRYCGADCSNARSWDGGDLYACPPCSDGRARSKSERWAIRVEFDAEPEIEAAVGYRSIAAAAAVMRLLNDEYDLWPERVEVHRI